MVIASSDTAVTATASALDVTLILLRRLDAKV
jgi:hypothetical protein